MSIFTVMLYSRVLFLFYCADANNYTHGYQGRQQAEMALRILDYNHFNKVRKYIEMNEIKLTGFYHTSTWRSEWKVVIGEQLLLMDGKRLKVSEFERYEDPKNQDTRIPWGTKYWSSLLDLSDSLVLNVAEPRIDAKDKVKKLIDSLNLRYGEKINLQYNRTVDRDEFGDRPEKERNAFKSNHANADVSIGEVSTMLKLHNHCKNETSLGHRAYVYYIHSKGSCCSKRTEGTQYVTTWREAMNAFNLEFPSICLRALNEGYAVCGMENQDGHYSGNFWYANCEHVAKLPSLENMYDAYEVEYFVFKVSHHKKINKAWGSRCGFSTHNFRVNHYAVKKNRKEYIFKLFENLMPSQSIKNPVSQYPSESKEDAIKKCINDYRTIGTSYMSRQWENQGYKH